ncbi:hypothetical protein Tco_0484194, partial [Tanacetum coccineum]
IHMMIEEKYPLTQEMLSKMLSRKLEVDHENEMAFELLRFIRSQVNHKFRGGLLGFRASTLSTASCSAKPGAKTGHKKPATSSKQPSMSSKEATKGGSSKAPTVSTHVDTEMHKEDQQATGGPTSLGITSEERANSQLSSGMSALNLNKPIFSAFFIIHSESASGHDVSTDFTAEADPGLSAPNDSIPPQQGMDEGTKKTSYDHIFTGTDPHVRADQTKSVNEGLETVLTQPITKKGASSNAIHDDKEEASSTIKLEDLAKLVSQIQPSFKDLDSPEDDPVIIADESDEDEPNDKTEDTSVPRSSSPKSSQIQELTKQVLILQSQKHKLELEKNKAEAEAALLKAQPSFPNVEQLNELLWELPKEFLSLPAKVESAQAKLKTLDALPSLLLNVTKLETNLQVLELHSTKSWRSNDSDEEAHVTDSMVKSFKEKKLKKFDFVTEGGEHVHLTKEQISAQKEIEEEVKAEAARQNKYYNDKLQYDKYCDKMLNRRASSRITNCDVLTKKGPITLKVYREDDTSEIIPNFKASDLHLGEWREVMKACLKRTGKGWEIIYKQIGTRMDYIHTTEVELGINLDIPLSKHDPLDKLNDLANKKRKHADDIHDYFKATKRLKSSVQYRDHLPGTVLNEPVLDIDVDRLGRLGEVKKLEMDKSQGIKQRAILVVMLNDLIHCAF